MCFGGNQTCLEKDVQPGVGSTDPIPITMHVTLTLQTHKHVLWILPGVPFRRCMLSSMHAWFHMSVFLRDPMMFRVAPQGFSLPLSQGFLPSPKEGSEKGILPTNHSEIMNNTLISHLSLLQFFLDPSFWIPLWGAVIFVNASQRRSTPVSLTITAYRPYHSESATPSKCLAAGRDREHPRKPACPLDVSGRSRARVRPRRFTVLPAAVRCDMVLHQAFRTGGVRKKGHRR